MEYIFSQLSDLSHYTAEAFVVRCFDDRFWKTFKNFLKSLGIKHIDPASVAGGAKIFASPEKEADRDFMLRELEKSMRLHHTTKIMLFTHHDCGAYGGFAKFDNDESKELEKAKLALKKVRENDEAGYTEIKNETAPIVAAGKRLFITCSGMGATRQLLKILEEEFCINDYDDHLSVSGSVNSLSEDQTEQVFRWADTDRIKFHIQAHSLQRIIVIIHNKECGWVNKIIKEFPQKFDGVIDSHEAILGNSVAVLKREVAEFSRAIPIEIYELQIIDGRAQCHKIQI